MTPSNAERTKLWRRARPRMGGKRLVAGGAFLALAALSLTSLALVSNDAAPPAPDAPPTPIYERHDDCKSVPCFASAAEDEFVVAEGVHEIAFVLYAVLDDATGPARLTIVDPSGDVRYERLLVPEAPAAHATSAVLQDAQTWDAEAGRWTLTRSYVGTSGTLTFDAWGIRLA